MKKTISSVLLKVKNARAYSSAGKTNDFIVRSELPRFQIPELTANEMLWNKVDLWPDKIAIECAESGKRYSYRELLTNSRRLGSWLARARVRGGDVVSVVLPNTPQFAVAALGALQARCTVSPVNPTYTEYEFHHMFSIARPKVIVTNDVCYNTVVKALTKLNHEAKIVIVDKPNDSIPSGSIRFTEVAENGDVDKDLIKQAQQDSSMNDLLFLPFSSGTTGLPKAVQITQKNIVSGLRMIDDKEVCLPDPATASFQEVVPCLLPFYHIFGLIILLLGHLRHGAKLLTMSHFNVDVYLDTLIKGRASLLYVVPPLAIFLGKSDMVTSEHMASAKYLLCGAAPLSNQDIQVLLKKAPNTEVIQAYGATETTSICTTMYKGSVKDYDGVGFPCSNTELRLVCPVSGDVLPADKVGELEIRGPQVTPGYYKNDEANASSFSSDGFYRSGDLATFSRSGGLQIKDRLKELIKVKGLQVAPAELEGILRSHPAVLEAAVTGVPDQLCGEVPRAFVVLKSEDNKPSEEEMMEYVAKKVASFKRIHRLQFVSDLPKTNTGKILRRKLLEVYD